MPRRPADLVPPLPSNAPDDLEAACYALSERLAHLSLPLTDEDCAFLPVHVLAKRLLSRHHPRDRALDFALWERCVGLALRAWLLGAIENHPWRSFVEALPAGRAEFDAFVAGLPERFGRWAVEAGRVMREERGLEPDHERSTPRARALADLWRACHDAGDLYAPGTDLLAAARRGAPGDCQRGLPRRERDADAAALLSLQAKDRASFASLLWVDGEGHVRLDPSAFRSGVRKSHAWRPGADDKALPGAGASSLDKAKEREGRAAADERAAVGAAHEAVDTAAGIADVLPAYEALRREVDALVARARHPLPGASAALAYVVAEAIAATTGHDRRSRRECAEAAGVTEKALRVAEPEVRRRWGALRQRLAS